MCVSCMFYDDGYSWKGGKKLYFMGKNLSGRVTGNIKQLL